MNLVKEKLIKSMMMLFILLLTIIAMAVILFGVNQFKIGSQLAGINQVANLSHVLVRQQANLFSTLLINNANTETLSEQLARLAREEFVIDASIYNREGKLLAQNESSNNLREQLGLEHKSGSELNLQQIVEPIYSGNGVEGFLRVTFDTKYGQTTQGKINQIFHKLYGELIIVFLLGVVLASSVHYFLSHYRLANRKLLETKGMIKNKKTSNAFSYHRRRRRV